MPSKKIAKKKTGSLSKRIWKFQESAVSIALEEHIKATKVHWNSDKSFTPDGMSIDPDVIIGTDIDQPEALVFVTHAAAEMAGQKKFWRTVAEVVEAKKLGSEPKVLSVLFSGNVKAELKVAYSYLFDGVFHLGGKEGAEFSQLITALAIKHGDKPAEACRKILVKLVAEGAVPHWKWFSGKIKSLSEMKTGATHDLITSGAFQSTCRKPEDARMTSLRRSICKLVTLPPEVRDPLLKGTMPVTIPLHAIYLEWFEEGISGEIEYSFGDGDTEENELKEFLDACRKPDAGCSIDDVRYLIKRAEKDLPNFVGYAKKLREVGDRIHCFQWIIDNLADLSTSAGMEKALREVFANPSLALDREGAPSDHWLFDSMMVLLRTESGQSDGYGYAELSNDTGIVDGITGGYIIVADFKNRIKDLPPNLYSAIAGTFSGHLSRLGVKGISGLLAEVSGVACKSVFNFQMMNYRNFNPIDWLVSKKLKGAKIPVLLNDAHPSFLSKQLKGSATSTKNIISSSSKKVWIKCQSGYDGKIDKRKELCGRIGAMKLCYDAKGLAERQFLLVIDGFFDDDDINLFEAAGWDGVFYYDELADLTDHVHGQ
jgi:hypothetical protein